MRSFLVALVLTFAAIGSASAEISVGVSIGINVPLYPQLVAVPGYPVYYAPGVDGNFFFYDGLYWVYDDDRWYAASWYNGPWRFMEPAFVPLFLLRVPVLYYRRPPPYFGGWRREAPPRWGEHWGRDWEDRHHGWDHWDRAAVPRRAPLPGYQRNYGGERYPHGDEQRLLHERSYRYAPHDRAVREQFRAEGGRAAPERAAREDRNPARAPAAAPRNDRPPQARRPPEPRSAPQERREPDRGRPAEASPRQRAPESAPGAPRGDRERARAESARAEPARGREPEAHGARERARAEPARAEPARGREPEARGDRARERGPEDRPH